MRDRPDPAAVNWLDAQPAESVWTTSITVLEVRMGLELLRPAGAAPDYKPPSTSSCKTTWTAASSRSTQPPLTQPGTLWPKPSDMAAPPRSATGRSRALPWPAAPRSRPATPGPSSRLA
ncbi:MAG TPA: hypothetical protein VG899_00005 [Mycobacteriales bacterium]|nr:hypothetical protein [Mycobacteriales bacterium]